MKLELDKIIKPDQTIEEVEDSIYSVIPANDREHEYDNKVTMYDKVIANPIYNSLIWGNAVNNYGDFCETAINSYSEGIAIDVGCGSLVFTAEVFSKYTKRPLILFDRSLEMIRAAKSRLIDLGGIPDNIVFLQGDALNLPFKENSFDSLLSFGMYHIFEGHDMISEILRVGKDNSDIYLTVFITDRWLGGMFLKLFKKKGLVQKVESSQDIADKLESLGLKMELKTIGNFAYLSRKHG